MLVPLIAPCYAQSDDLKKRLKLSLEENFKNGEEETVIKYYLLVITQYFIHFIITWLQKPILCRTNL